MKAAVLGSPIAHSLSPAVHAAGYAALGLTDWSYTLVEMDVAGLPGFVAGLDEQWRGLSLTMPLKEVCLEVAGVVTPLARSAGAGNTLVRQAEGGWLADNTDVPGLVDALSPAWQRGTRAAILGAGATARSTVLALASMGFPTSRIRAIGRTGPSLRVGGDRRPTSPRCGTAGALDDGHIRPCCRPTRRGHDPSCCRSPHGLLSMRSTPPGQRLWRAPPPPG